MTQYCTPAVGLTHFSMVCVLHTLTSTGGACKPCRKAGSIPPVLRTSMLSCIVQPCRRPAQNKGQLCSIMNALCVVYMFTYRNKGVVDQTAINAVGASECRLAKAFECIVCCASAARFNMVLSAVCSLANVSSETVAALWAEIYVNLRSDEISRGIARHFKNCFPH